MPRYYRRRKYARKPSCKPRKSARKLSYYKGNKKLVRTIKRVVHDIAENKVQSDYAVNRTIVTANATNPTYLNVTLSPSQGTTVQQRTGNIVRVVKASVRGFVNVLPYNALTNPLPSSIWVKMWLCRRKNFNANNLPNATDFSNFFQSGSTSLGFQGNMLDITLRNNTEYWTILGTKTVQLTNFFCNGTTGTSALGQSGPNSVPFSFDLTKHLGMCRFNDTTTFPQNKELYVVFQSVNADGSTSAVNSAEYHFSTEWQYEDA